MPGNAVRSDGCGAEGGPVEGSCNRTELDVVNAAGDAGEGQARLAATDLDAFMEKALARRKQNRETLERYKEYYGLDTFKMYMSGDRQQRQRPHGAGQARHPHRHGPRGRGGGVAGGGFVVMEPWLRSDRRNRHNMRRSCAASKSRPHPRK